MGIGMINGVRKELGLGWSLFVAVVVATAVISCPGAHGGATGVDVTGFGLRDSGADGLHGNDEIDASGVDAGDLHRVEDERVGQLVALEAEPLAPFFEALAQLEEDGTGTVRVLQWGDSHTAADFVTSEIRHLLQERFGDSGRGFMLLGRPWRSYRPKDVKLDAGGDWRAERILIAADPATLDGRYGLGGVSVESRDPSAWTTVATSSSTGFNRVASSFEVFFLKQPRGGSFRVLVDGAPRVTVSTAASSFSTGFVKVAVDKGEHEFEVRVIGDRRVRLFGATVENDGPGVVYDSLGVNGGFFHTPLRWDAELLAEQVARRNPDLLVAMYGTNEADSRTINPSSYARMVRKTMARFRAGAPEAACMLFGPPDRRVASNGDDEPTQLDWIIDVQGEVASEIGCAFLDLRELMGGPGSYNWWTVRNPRLARGDGVHLTVQGYRELGRQVVEEILSAYEDYLDTADNPLDRDADR